MHRRTAIEAVSCTYVDSRVDCHAECPNIRRHTGHSWVAVRSACTGTARSSCYTSLDDRPATAHCP